MDFMPERVTKPLENTSIGFLIKCFSVKNNSKAIFSLEQYEKFKALDGFRAVLTLWVVWVHTYESGYLIMNIRNYYHSSPYKAMYNYRNMLIPNPLLMDNFVLISGMKYYKLDHKKFTYQDPFL